MALLIILLLLIPAVTFGQPTISSATVSSGVLTVTGTGFGTKSSTYVWDNFEDGALANATVGNWSSTNRLDSVVSTFPRHANSTYSAYMNVRDSDSRACVTGGSNSQTWFVTYRFRLGSNWVWNPVISGFLGNVKIFRMWESGAGTENFVCAAHPNGAGGSGSGLICITETVQNPDWVTASADGYVAWNPQASISTETWHLFEFEFRDSDPDTANGVFRMWFNGTQIVNSDTDVVGATGIITRTAGDAFKRPFIVGILNSAGSGNADFQLDDAFIDNSWARVHICPGSTWNTRGSCEIQPITSWSNTTITATLNRGAIGTTGYVYVVDANGNRSSGFQINFTATRRARMLMMIG
jgi:hypothetical protein